MLENESLLDRQVNPDLPKDNRRKLKIAFVAIIFFGLGTLIGNNVYQYYSAANSVAQYEKDYIARMEAERAVKMADTYGGKTPAETLSLYIEAVKKGDYELASKYFIESNKTTEIKSFENAKPENIQKIISLLERAVVGLKNGEGSWAFDKTGFAISNPILVDFELYPNGIWKLIKI